MTANPSAGFLHQDICLLIGFSCAEIMNIPSLALRLADYDYANRARSVGFLTWIHGAKVHIFGLATPKDTREISQNPCKTASAIMWHRKVMKSGKVVVQAFELLAAELRGLVQAFELPVAGLRGLVQAFELLAAELRSLVQAFELPVAELRGLVQAFELLGAALES
jgi:hypothetical protein